MLAVQYPHSPCDVVVWIHNDILSRQIAMVDEEWSLIQLPMYYFVK